MNSDSISLPKSALVFWVSLLCLGSSVDLQMQCCVANGSADLEQMGPWSYRKTPFCPIWISVVSLQTPLDPDGPSSSVRHTSPRGQAVFQEPMSVLSPSMLRGRHPAPGYGSQ